MPTNMSNIINAIRDEIVKYGTIENLNKFNSQDEEPPLSSGHEFTRNRKMPLRDFLGFLIWPKAESLTVELFNYSELIGKDNVTKNDFSHRRKFIPYGYIRSLNKSIVRTYYDKNDRIDTWNGHILLAGDGTTYAIPTTEKLKESFMQGRRSGRVDQPLARGIVVKDVLNGLIVASDMECYGRDEIKLLIDELDDIPSVINDLHPVIILDRKYCAYTLISKLMQSKMDFVIRVKGRFNKDVDDFVGSGLREAIITLHPAITTVKKLRRLYGADIKTDDLKVKLVRLKNNIIVMTSLLNESIDGDYESDIYHKRWDDETTIGFVKNNLQVEIFTGVSDNSVRQDFYSKTITYNLLSVMIEQAARMRHASTAGKGLRKYRINRNVALGIFKILSPEFLHNDKGFNTPLTKMLTQMSRYTTEVIPGRHNPRLFRGIKRSGKYLTLTNYARVI